MTIAENDRNLPYTRRARYFRAFIPTEVADPDCGPGIWYAEFSDRIARRQFERYAQRTFVAPHDIRFADQLELIMHDDRYEEITFAQFQEAWRESAEVRLDEIAKTLPR